MDGCHTDDKSLSYLSLQRVPGDLGLGQLLLEGEGLLALLLLPLLLQRQAGLQLSHLTLLLLLLHVEDLQLRPSEDIVGEGRENLEKKRDLSGPEAS